SISLSARATFASREGDLACPEASAGIGGCYRLVSRATSYRELEEEEEDPEEDPKEDPEEEPEDDDDDMEMDDEAEVIDPFMDDGSNNPSPPNSEDEETPPTSSVIPDADGMERNFIENSVNICVRCCKIVKSLKRKLHNLEEIYQNQ
nr:hypothetical protein [Tanacetum cinerariifolium]